MKCHAGPRIRFGAGFDPAFSVLLVPVLRRDDVWIPAFVVMTILRYIIAGVIILHSGYVDKQVS
jgi:hypothetical protein